MRTEEIDLSKLESFAANCKACGRNLVAKYDPDCPGLSVALWATLLCCNRCADFERAWRRDLEAASAFAFDLLPDRGMSAEQCEKIRGHIVRHAISAKNALCRFLNADGMSDAEFARGIMEQPTRVAQVLAFYRLQSFRSSGWRKKKPELQMQLA